MPIATHPAKLAHAADQFLAERMSAWLGSLSAQQVIDIRQAYQLHMASQRKIAAVLARLQPLDAFAKRMLETQLGRSMGLHIDLARAVWREERRQFTLKPDQLPVDHSYFVRMPALQKLMQNFQAGESFYSETALVYPADQAAGAAEQVLSKDSDGVVELCRSVDVGHQYQQHLAQLLTENFAREVATDIRLALALRTEIAASRRLIPSEELRVLRDLAQGRSPRHAVSTDVRCGPLQMLNSVLDGVLAVELSGSWLPSVSVPIEVKAVNGILLVMPDDPDNPVRHFATWGAVNTLLLVWMESPVKRHKLLQRVALQDRAAFMHTLNLRLLDDEPDLAPSLQRVDGALFETLAAAHLERIREDARFLAVPNADVDARQSRDRLALMQSVGLALVNLAGLFVPGVGQLLLADMVISTLREVCEGVADWSQGHQHEALEHMLAVAESVAVNAATAAGARLVAGAFTRSAWVDGLEPVINDEGEQRLWFNTLAPYVDPNPPSPLTTLDNGLLSDGTDHWWLQQGVYYRVRANSDQGPWRLLGARDPQAFGPALEFNGERAWRLTYERPLEWQGQALLLGRLWPPAQAFTDERAAQVMAVAGVDEDLLRGLLVENRQLPVALRDTLERFAVDARVEHFLGAVGSGAADTDAELWQWCVDHLGIQTLDLRTQSDTIVQQADELRERLFEHFANVYWADDPQRALLQRDFPGLPDAYAVSLLRHLSNEQRVAMRTGLRIPLAVAKQARQLLQVAQLTRMREGLYLRCSYRADQVRLVFALLSQAGRWPATQPLALHERSATGRLLASLHQPALAKPYPILVRAAGKFRLFGPTQAPLHGATGEPGELLELLLSCLSGADKARLGWAGADGAAKLRKALQGWLPRQREDMLRLLGMPDAGAPSNPVRRLPDGRVGYLLSGRMTGGGAAQNLLQSRIRALYPGFNEAEVQIYLELLLERPGSAYSNLLLQERQYRMLEQALAQWVSRARGDTASALRRQAALQLQRSWQLIGERIIDQWDVPQGLTLSLHDIPLRSLPHLPANTDFGHVAHLTLMGLSLDELPDGFLRCFTQLRWLNLGNNVLTSIPNDLAHLGQLRNLRLAGNQISVTVAGARALASLTRLRTLDLSYNPLGATSVQLQTMLRLEELNLRGTQLLALPDDLQQCAQLIVADLRDNHITGVSEAVLAAPERWRRTLLLEGNPLPEAISQRLGRPLRAIEAGAGTPPPTASTRGLWLEDSGEQYQARSALWDALSVEPGSQDFFQLLDALTGTQDFERVPADLRRRVWVVLEQAAGDTSLRDDLFSLAAHPRTCMDSVASCFSRLEVQVYVAQALRESPPQAGRLARLELARRLFRLDQVETLAREDMQVRRTQGQDVDEVEMSLAYRIGLARVLDLPGQPRTMHFPALSGVNQHHLDTAAMAVRHAETTDALARYVSQRDFWLDSLRSSHGQLFSEVEAPFWSQLEALDNSPSSSGDYLLAANRLADERQAAVKELALRLTREALAELPDPAS
ncbi:NEL-type E3 ubiquitin ligase domain-containing protein [Pseudomonas promysalinigenes]|uniref:NEL-type E3 ubiquitin ligase domain-containing protein n=1 Tax=Pseudomonas promysalinigenes TaxID=485898 RepID=UPI00391702DF